MNSLLLALWLSLYVWASPVGLVECWIGKERCCCEWCWVAVVLGNFGLQSVGSELGYCLLLCSPGDWNGMSLLCVGHSSGE